MFEEAAVMRCERCRTADAVVHVTQIRDGAVAQLHLCHACADAAGMMGPPPPPPGQWEPLAEVEPDRPS